MTRPFSFKIPAIVNGVAYRYGNNPELDRLQDQLDAIGRDIQAIADQANELTKKKGQDDEL